MANNKDMKDTFTDLKTHIIGTKTSKVDAKLDKAIKDIVNYKSNSGRAGVIDLLTTLISKNSEEVNTNNLNSMFGMGGANTPASLGQGNRMSRYNVYESIVGTINYCHRALAVLVDNILAPDDITKFSLEVTEINKYTDDSYDSKVNEVKALIAQLGIEKKLHLLIRNTLMDGDYFVEIADSKTAALSKSSILNENLIRFEGEVKDAISEAYDKFTYKLNEETTVKVNIDYTSYIDENDSNIENFSDVKLLMYDPKRVVKLQSQMFPICFGYLVFPVNTVSPQLNAEEQSINQLCLNILKKIEAKIPQIKDLQNNKDLVDVVHTMIATSGTANMDIRYVAADKMQHFMVPGTKYYPYGESLFDSTQYTAKVLIALETALAIQRLNRSTEKRKIMVELGLPRDAKELVDNIKTEFNKRKISLDDLGAVDTIPSMITTFEDIYIPQKDGKPFVDVQTMTEGNVDIRSKVDELKFLRDQLVSSLGIPPAFLNIEENLSNKAALAEENILFARTIISHQKYLSEQINSLIEKIYNVVKPDEAMDIAQRVQVAFPPPKSLQFERQARYMSELANLVRTLEEIGVPKEWARKKYLTSIDWDDVDRFIIKDKIDKEANTGEKEDDGMGGMGGMGGGMGGPTF